MTVRTKATFPAIPSSILSQTSSHSCYMLLFFTVLHSAIVFLPFCRSFPPSLTHILYSCPPLLPILLFSSSPVYSVCVCVCVRRGGAGGWESFLLSQSTVLLLTLACYLSTVFSLLVFSRWVDGYTDRRFCLSLCWQSLSCSVYLCQSLDVRGSWLLKTLL